MDFPFMPLILWYVYIYIYLISLYIYIFIYIYNRLCIIYYYIILYPMTPRYNQRSPRMTRHRKRLRLKGKGLLRGVPRKESQGIHGPLATIHRPVATSGHHEPTDENMFENPGKMVFLCTKHGDFVRIYGCLMIAKLAQ